MDDGYLHHVVCPALEIFERQVREKCNLIVLKRLKTVVFTGSEHLSRETPKGLGMAGMEVSGVFLRGFVYCGISVGTGSYEQHMIGLKEDEVAVGRGG